MRMITAADLEEIALGAAVLGTGGGGDPYIGKLLAIEAIRRHGPVRLLDVDALDDDDLIVPTAMMGAPSVMVEKIPRGDEIIHAFQTMEHFLGRKITATMSIEAGGLNSTTPFSLAAALGLPLVDADGMGRAFPEIPMVTLGIDGISASPFTLADEKGNTLVINTSDNHWTERFARTASIEMGCSAMLACFPMTGRQLKQSAVPGTISLCQRIGRAIREAHQRKHNPIDAVLGVTGGYRLFRGKIADIQRRTVRGFTRGDALITGGEGYAEQECQIQFQNEYLVARTATDVLASSPDLITILDAETGEPITTEALRYGFRVDVLGIPCDRRWRTPRGLELVGPQYFGYDFAYVPLEDRVAARRGQ
ncbi:MAG TPA: DUF917 domain-containing protein [Herpetosiphonaceae bacterium]